MKHVARREHPSTYLCGWPVDKPQSGLGRCQDCLAKSFPGAHDIQVDLTFRICPDVRIVAALVGRPDDGSDEYYVEASEKVEAWALNNVLEAIQYDDRPTASAV